MTLWTSCHFGLTSGPCDTMHMVLMIYHESMMMVKRAAFKSECGIRWGLRLLSYQFNIIGRSQELAP
jgi:hypothetical protein